MKEGQCHQNQPTTSNEEEDGAVKVHEESVGGSFKKDGHARAESTSVPSLTVENDDRQKIFLFLPLSLLLINLVDN